MAKIGRNAPCPCGSGKKYKACCGSQAKGPAGKTVPSAGEPLVTVRREGPMPSMEGTLSDLRRLLEGKNFETTEEMNAFIQNAMAGQGGHFPQPAHMSDLERAQELMYEARESPAPKRYSLAEQALALSPDCADAHLLLTERERDPIKRMERLRLAVAAGERALGERAFAEDVGYFWLS